MLKNLIKTAAAACICGVFLSAAPGEAGAASYAADCVGVETSSSYIVKIDAPAVKLYAEDRMSSDVAGRVKQGETYDVISYDRGWVKIDTESAEGYLRVAGQATVVETTREKVDEAAALRAAVVDYALQFVGNRYVWGGTNPNTGVDCSGFTAYVMRHMAGVSLSHSSAAQAGEGRTVPVDDAKPGDLLFYSSGSGINHVAIYMGGGQIVHASSAKTGIKISKWKYRSPVKAVSVLPR